MHGVVIEGWKHSGHSRWEGGGVGEGGVLGAWGCHGRLLGEELWKVTDVCWSTRMLLWQLEMRDIRQVCYDIGCHDVYNDRNGQISINHNKRSTVRCDMSSIALPAVGTDLSCL